MDNFIDKLAQKFTAGEVIRANQVAEEKELRRLREQVAEYERCLNELNKIRTSQADAAKQLQELAEKIKLQMQEMNDNEYKKLAELGLSNLEKIKIITDESLGNVGKITDEGLESVKNITGEGLESLNKVTNESLENVNKVTHEGLESLNKVTMESLEQLRTQQTFYEERLKEREEALEQTRTTTNEVSTIVKELNELLDSNQKELMEKFNSSDDYLHKENVKVYRNVQAVVIDETTKRTEEIIKKNQEQITKYGKPALVFAILAALASAGSLIISILQLSGILLK